MTRALSGAVLLLLAVALVWFAPGALFFAVAEGLLLIAFGEYAALARASGVPIPEAPAAVAAAITCAAFSPLTFGIPWVALDVALMSALVTLGALTLVHWRGGSDALAMVSAAIFPSLYLGLPTGAIIAIRETHGRAVLFLLILTVVVSDIAQYYTGRAFGRRPLSPAISPKKTIEGAVGGFVCGGLCLLLIGSWWLPALPGPLRAGLGVTIVALGICGDLFESMLKRSAGVKDSSGLIPGHGGILDRIDALLFAAPVYYIVLKYV